MQLSKRLEAVASFVTEGNRLVDVGTDHGYIPIYLVETGKTKEAIAMDINQGPLERAESNIKKSGLEDKIKTRLSDGLQNLKKDEGDTVVIAGMGGGLIIKILSEGKELIEGMKELVLSPQSEIPLVRKYLEMEEFSIIKETIIKEDGKYYFIMKVVPGKKKSEEMSPQQELYDYFGEYLLKNANPLLKEFLLKEQYTSCVLEEELSKQNSEAGKLRLEEIRQQINRIEEALFYYEM